ncbi:MAG: hypothetical protein IJH07_07575 [Ruminococcus sp.]|nr:hypothetical protein [Ruminococcus sp.]
MKVQRLLAAVILTAVLMSGCTSLSLSDPDILSPPKAAGDRAEVQSIIEKDAKGAYALIYPAAGDYKNGIIQNDLNGDGVNEAIALFTASDGTPRLLAAMKQDDSYRLYGSTELPSADVSRLSFADVNADGTKEPVIGFGDGTSFMQTEVFLFDEGVSGITVGEGCIDYVIGDFDGNSSDDILLMTPSGGTAAKARLLVYSEDGFGEKSSCETDAEVTAFLSLRFDQISDGLYGAVADGIRGDGAYSTQLLYYDSAAHIMVNPLYMNSSYSESVRASDVTCTDIDGDGIIEIPLCSLSEHTEDEDPDTVCSIVRWSDYDPELMAPVFTQGAVLCDKLDCMLRFSAEMLAIIAARYTADNAVTLYDLSFKGDEPVLGRELLTVKRYAKNSYDSSLTAEAKLRDSASYTYTYILSEGSTFTHDDINDSFYLLTL